MNNRRGQVFVAFVVLLPIIIMFLAYVIDNGVINAQKSKLDELTKSVLSYALSNRNQSEEQLEEYIKRNEPELKQIQIILDEDIQIKLEKEIDSIFGKAIGIQNYTFSSYYQGEIKEGKQVIRKVEK